MLHLYYTAVYKSGKGFGVGSVGFCVGVVVVLLEAIQVIGQPILHEVSQPARQLFAHCSAPPTMVSIISKFINALASAFNSSVVIIVDFNNSFSERNLRKYFNSQINCGLFS